MKPSTKTALLKELIDLEQSNQQFLDEKWVREPINRYIDPKGFADEQTAIFKQLPQIAAHASELDGENSFITRDIAGVPLLLVRTSGGGVKTYYNVCRHRGARLVADENGCKKRFSCPYHAWTYTNEGQLVAVPHEASGFPEIDRKKLGLKEVLCEERDGWVWVNLSENSTTTLDHDLGELNEDLNKLQAGEHVAFDSTTLTINANWKILIEGGLEAYHFKVAHRDSIAPLFLDNLSSYQCFGVNIRSILPRASLTELENTDESEWDIRKHANILYTFLPSTQFLVQEDHFVWIRSRALAVDCTELILTTMVPKAALDADKNKYWQANHDFTLRTLQEDFDMAESIQQGLTSGANTHLNFGRFEGALAQLNSIVDRLISAQR